MIRPIYTIAVVLLLTAVSSASAEMRVLAHYELDRDVSRVTYVAGPERMRDIADQGKALQRQASPRFVASAPPHRAGGGSLQFDGDKDMYSREGAIFGAHDNFVMEAWALAEEANHAGLRGVVANGSGAQGYVLGQYGDRWVAFVGSVGAFDLGPVHVGQWVHLAIVNDGGDAGVYFNGERIRDIRLSPAVAPSFALAMRACPPKASRG